VYGSNLRRWRRWTLTPSDRCARSGRPRGHDVESVAGGRHANQDGFVKLYVREGGLFRAPLVAGALLVYSFSPSSSKGHPHGSTARTEL